MKARRSVNMVLVAMILFAAGGGVLAQPGEAVPAEAQGPGPQSAASPLDSLGTAFTYRGQLKQAGGSFTGNCSMRFSLYDDATINSQVGSPITATVPVTAGQFIVSLDFGNVFTGEPRWLELSVKCGSDAGYTLLAPRQSLTAVPYAMSLPGLHTQPNAISPNVIGGHAGNLVAPGVTGATIGGGGLAGAPNSIAASLGTIGGGYSNTIASEGSTIGGGVNNFAGGPPLALYSSVATSVTAPATVGGGSHNRAYGFAATVGGGDSNNAIGTAATVGGGRANRAGGEFAVVGGGYGNNADGGYPTMGGGYYNQVTGDFAVVGGGRDNTAYGFGATVAGGNNNTASGAVATVGGGYLNAASGPTTTISGGMYNTAAGDYATIGGGRSNIVSGTAATVPGGDSNTASGDYSFAAGRRAKAGNYGAFVWADGTSADYSSTANNQFAVRATGGVSFATGSAPFLVNGNPLQVRVTGTCTGSDAVQAINADGTVNCVAAGSGAGDITGVYAGNGLAGGGASGEVTLRVVFSGTGVSNMAARSDHTHSGADISSGVIGDAYLPASIARVSQITPTVAAAGFITRTLADWLYTYSAGSGLMRTGNAFSVVTSTIQQRVTGACTGSAAVQAINADGTVTCTAAGGGSAWSLTGNAGTAFGANLLGTTDNVSLTLAVNNASALRLEPASSSPNLVGGYGGNAIAPGVYGASIGGGGYSGGVNSIGSGSSWSTLGGGVGNSVGGSNQFVTIGGGQSNAIVSGGGHALIGGGESNLIAGSNATHATIGGGKSNALGGGDVYMSTIGGGTSNVISGTSAYYSTIGGGGFNNVLGGSVSAATIAGGSNNTISGTTANQSTIGGGDNNVISGALAYGATIGGGRGNVIGGASATIPGGEYNAALGSFSLAAGQRAKANHAGSFVWGDGALADISSSSTNQFIARANGGFWFGQATADLTPTIAANVLISTSTGAYLSTGGAWTNASSRDIKDNLAPVDGRAVLAQLARVPISTWNYAAQDASIHHIGPMAQDFSAAFGVGDDNTSISTVDADGVSLAAIQGLYAVVQDKEAQIAALQAQSAAQQQEIGDLQQRMAALEARLNGSASPGPVASNWGLIGLALAGLAVGVVVARRGGAR